MSGSPLVSIVINNYNYGRFLRECIDSALSQTHRNTEVIVVDDGSPDDSRDIITRCGDRVIPVLKANGGQASAFNAGFAASRGEVILFLDADDLLLPTAAERALLHLRESDAVKVHWQLQVIDEQGHASGALMPGVSLCQGDVAELALRKGPISSVHSPTTGNAWARWFLEEAMPVQECGDKHGADAYLFTVAEIAGPIMREDQPLGCYRVHPTAFSGRSVEYELRRDLRRYDHHCRVLSQHLARRGVHVDPAAWKGPDSPYAWMEQLLAASEEVAMLVPLGEAFILVDEYNLGTKSIAGRQAFPFLERHGEYWGSPEDDTVAIRELERLRRKGARYIFFASPALWWLEYYTGLHHHLRHHFRCLRENDRLVVFDLRRPVSSEGVGA
jgi:glycosyltransferase involved in cell wall biosynthesis